MKVVHVAVKKGFTRLAILVDTVHSLVVVELKQILYVWIYRVNGQFSFRRYRLYCR
jgi:hypothetical protein